MARAIKGRIPFCFQFASFVGAYRGKSKELVTPAHDKNSFVAKRAVDPVGCIVSGRPSIDHLDVFRECGAGAASGSKGAGQNQKFAAGDFHAELKLKNKTRNDTPMCFRPGATVNWEDKPDSGPRLHAAN